MQTRMKVPQTIIQELAIGSLTAIAIAAMFCDFSEGIIVGAIGAISAIGGYAIRQNGSNK